MQLESKIHISPLLATESPVAQWVEHPTRSRKVVASNPIWDSDFSELPVGSINISFHIVIIIIIIIIIISDLRIDNWSWHIE